MSGKIDWQTSDERSARDSAGDRSISVTDARGCAHPVGSYREENTEVVVKTLSAFVPVFVTGRIPQWRSAQTPTRRARSSLRGRPTRSPELPAQLAGIGAGADRDR